eukprot:TRINITY_DN35567_c0_g1_i10.p1 TRINITY_DN35567_c0_g1~~TRINITY_DN35567_c0_g1_i10.p1  ORF type:complete len:206 (+),score=-10.04 TRINITY_DN35567_c0_g1_i10:36-620(+)
MDWIFQYFYFFLKVLFFQEKNPFNSYNIISRKLQYMIVDMWFSTFHATFRRTNKATKIYQMEKEKKSTFFSLSAQEKKLCFLFTYIREKNFTDYIYGYIYVIKTKYFKIQQDDAFSYLYLTKQDIFRASSFMTIFHTYVPINVPTNYCFKKMYKQITKFDNQKRISILILKYAFMQQISLANEQIEYGKFLIFK